MQGLGLGESPMRTGLTAKDIRALTGAPEPIIVPKYLAPAGVAGSKEALADAFVDKGDKYAIALGRERTRIDKEKEAYKAAQLKKRGELETQAAAARKAYEAAKEKLSSIKIMNAGQGTVGGLYGQISVNQASTDAAKKAVNDALAALTSVRQQVVDFDTNYQTGFDEYFAPMEKNYQDATKFAIGIRDSTKKQSEYDTAYEKARQAYDNAVTQHDKDRAAYDMYKAQKDRYDQDSADRQADINAGRYAVNPYQFLAQGAGINEIDELRKQVNAGNLRPNMRVPDAFVAPKEVKDPGDFKTAAPVRERVKGPEGSDDVKKILGYTDPEPPKADAPLRQVSTEETDVSSVKDGYQSPAEKKQKPEPEKDASGNPVIQGAGTLQQTAGATPAPTQQTAAQAATPAPALPAQPTGSVGGQASSTGQEAVAPEQVKPEEKPAPFTPDEEEKEKQDSVF